MPRGSNSFEVESRDSSSSFKRKFVLDRENSGINPNRVKIPLLKVTKDCIEICDEEGSEIKDVLIEKQIIEDIEEKGIITKTKYRPYHKNSVGYVKFLSINSDEFTNEEFALTEDKEPKLVDILYIKLPKVNGVIIRTTDKNINPKDYLISFEIPNCNGQTINSPNIERDLLVCTEFYLLTIFGFNYDFKDIRNIKFFLKKDKPYNITHNIDRFRSDENYSEIEITNIANLTKNITLSTACFPSRYISNYRSKRYKDSVIDDYKDILCLQNIKKYMFIGMEKRKIMECIVSIDEKVDFGSISEMRGRLPIRERLNKDYVRAFLTLGDYFKNGCKESLLDNLLELALKKPTITVLDNVEDIKKYKNDKIISDDEDNDDDDISDYYEKYGKSPNFVTEEIIEIRHPYSCKVSFITPQTLCDSPGIESSSFANPQTLCDSESSSFVNPRFELSNMNELPNFELSNVDELPNFELSNVDELPNFMDKSPSTIEPPSFMDKPSGFIGVMDKSPDFIDESSFTFTDNESSFAEYSFAEYSFEDKEHNKSQTLCDSSNSELSSFVNPQTLCDRSNSFDDKEYNYADEFFEENYDSQTLCDSLGSESSSFMDHQTSNYVDLQTPSIADLQTLCDRLDDNKPNNFTDRYSTIPTIAPTIVEDSFCSESLITGDMFVSDSTTVVGDSLSSESYNMTDISNIFNESSSILEDIFVNEYGNNVNIFFDTFKYCIQE